MASTTSSTTSATSTNTTTVTATTITLLGPPQIPLSSLPTTTTTNTDTESTNTNNDSTNTDSDSDSDKSYSPGAHPYMGLTENRSATYKTTSNPPLDFFFHVVPKTPASELTRLVEASWSHDPLLTLKLICNLRAVRGTGKSDKEGFYIAALWLYNKHPKTLALNMGSISGFGYLKDMPEILFRLLEGSNTRKRKYEVTMGRRYGPCGAMGLRGRMGLLGLSKKEDDDKKEDEEEDEKKKEEKKENKEKARVLRLHKKNERTKKILDKYNNDDNFRVLYDSISDVFADLLKKDVELYQKGDLHKLGFAAKWCPTIDSSYDEVTLLCESIAKRVFPKGECEEYKDMEEAHYAFRVRDRLRKEVLVPLRKALELPEVYMCAKKWGELPYNRVPSVAMKLYKTLFYKHDEERFTGYLEKVKSGKATIAAGALLPHEIIASLDDDPDKGGEVAELQWKRMVDDLANKGKLNNCMAICDVSGSMGGDPMEVSVALGLLISELSEEPWKGKLITFSANPQFHLIKGNTLKEKTNFIRLMDWGMNTDLQKVFDRILEVAVKAKTPEEQMIRTLFIFSDMEFDEAAGRSHRWETDYMVIQRKFKQSGYNRVPEIVFWNLRRSKATPVPSTQPGVALVSGFSKNLMTLFLEEGGILSPEAVMLAAVSKPEYDPLVVYD